MIRWCGPALLQRGTINIWLPLLAHTRIPKTLHFEDCPDFAGRLIHFTLGLVCVAPFRDFLQPIRGNVPKAPEGIVLGMGCAQHIREVRQVFHFNSNVKSNEKSIPNLHVG